MTGRKKMKGIMNLDIDKYEKQRKKKAKCCNRIKEGKFCREETKIEKKQTILQDGKYEL